MVFDGQLQAERMRALQVCSEHILSVHGAGHRDLPGNNRVADSDRSIVAAQTQITVGAQDRLLALLVIGGAGVDLIGGLGLRLVPQCNTCRQS